MVGFVKKICFSTTGFSRGFRHESNFRNKEETDDRLANQNPTRKIAGVNR